MGSICSTCPLPARTTHIADTDDTRVNPKILKCAMCKRPELFKIEKAMARRCISVFRPVPPSTPAPDRFAPRALPIRYTPCAIPSQASRVQSSEFIRAKTTANQPTNCHACHNTASIAHQPGTDPTWAAQRSGPRARACRAPPPAARRRANRRLGTSCTARRRRAGRHCRRGRGRTRSAPRAAPPRR